jgi:hypothetical protein
VPIANSSLPIAHTAKIHGSTADSAGSALTDQIRLVHVQMTGSIVDVNTQKQVQRHLEGDVRLLNAGLVKHPTCGEAPLGTTLTVALGADNQSVDLTWPASVDESGGEKDVERYVVFRRSKTEAAFSNPLESIPAGAKTYTYNDPNLPSNSDWVYAVIAEDCTPVASPASQAGPIHIP